MTDGQGAEGFRIEAGEDLEKRLRDEEIPDEVAETLPFPVAYAWERIRREADPWERLFRDGLETLLRYLGLVAASEYLDEEGHRDPAVNDALKPLGRGGPSAGYWVQLIRRCARREVPGDRALPGLEEGWRRAEEESRVRVTWEKRSLAPDPQGLLSTLVTARNHLFGHGVAPEKPVRREAAGALTGVYRVALEELAPVWRHGLCLPIPAGHGRRHYRLRGLRDFEQVTPPPDAGDRGYLEGAGDRAVGLHSLALADRPGAGPGTLLDRSAELYLLNYLRRSEIPVYMGLAGEVGERPERADELSELFEEKRVWEKRRDLELDQVLSYASGEKAERTLEYVRRDRLYDPAVHLERAEVQDALDEYFEEDDTRLLFISGEAGSGKSSSLARWADRLQERGVPVLFLRGIELPEGEVTSVPRLEDWLCGELGWDGDLAEVLDRAAETEAGRLVLVVDGMNEFADLERDLDGLWRALNGLAERHAERRALKIVVSARPDGEEPEAYLPAGEPPAFADPVLYYKSGNTYYFEVGPFAEEQIAGLLRRHGVRSVRAERLAAEHPNRLSNPLLLTRVAEGGLTEDEIDELSGGGLTAKFIDQRLRESPDAKEVLRDLVRVLGDSESMALTMGQIRDRDENLADRLEANGEELLRRLQQLDLVRTHHIEGQDGRPVPALSLGDDQLFEHVWKKEVLRIGLRRNLRVGAGMLAVFGGAVALGAIALQIAVSNLLPDNLEGTLRHQLIGAGISASQATEFAAEVTRIATEIQRTARQLFVEDLMLHFFGFVVLVGVALEVASSLLGTVMSYQVNKARRGEPRLRFYSLRIEKSLAGRTAKLFIALILVFAIGALLRFGQGGRDALVTYLIEGAPWLGGMAFVGIAYPMAEVLVRLRVSGDAMLRRCYFSPDAVRRGVSQVPVYAFVTAIVAAIFFLAPQFRPSQLPGVEQAVETRTGRIVDLFGHLSQVRERIRRESAEGTLDSSGLLGRDPTMSEARNTFTELERLLSRRPLRLDSPVGQFVRRMTVWLLAGFVLGLIGFIVTQYLISRRLYRDEWQ